MKRKKPFALALAGLVVLLLALTVGAALTFADTAIPWRAFDSGGNSSGSTNYRLGSSAGQSSAIGQSQSTNYRLGAGFWYGAGCAHVVAGLCDTDGDGCTDVREQQTAIGSQTSGGRRDPQNPWDYFNPTHDGKIRVDDILKVVQQFGKDDTDGNPGLPPYTAGYNPDTDRTYIGPNLWNLGPPNGLQRVNDILAEVYQFGHDCP